MNCWMNSAAILSVSYGLESMFFFCRKSISMVIVPIHCLVLSKVYKETVKRKKKQHISEQDIPLTIYEIYSKLGSIHSSTQNKH